MLFFVCCLWQLRTTLCNPNHAPTTKYKLPESLLVVVVYRGFLPTTTIEKTIMQTINQQHSTTQAERKTVMLN